MLTKFAIALNLFVAGMALAGFSLGFGSRGVGLFFMLVCGGIGIFLLWWSP